VLFVAIILSTIVAYKLFIKHQVLQAVEYKTAVYFVEHSESVREQLLAAIVSIEFDDAKVVEKGDYGVCEIFFDLQLKDDLHERLRVGLVKVSDFWIVYEAELNPYTVAAYPLLDTYRKILFFVKTLEYPDDPSAQIALEAVKGEVLDQDLAHYLTARLLALSNKRDEARQLLDDLAKHVVYSKPAVMFERGTIDFSEKEYETAIRVYLEIEKEILSRRSNQDRHLKLRNLFRQMPNDPFNAMFSYESILADVYLNLSQAYVSVGQYEKGLEAAEKAIEQATEIKAKVTLGSARFAQAVILYAMGRYKDANDSFSGVISDLDNTNLTQKAWSYFHKAEIAVRLGKRSSYIVDYYETAVNLDPFNYPIRKGVIEFLMNRAGPGDLEVALGMALRGVDYGIEPELFSRYAGTLYQRLGIGGNND